MQTRRAILKAYDFTTHTATVQIDGSLPNYLATIAVAKSIAPVEMVAGRHVLIAWPDVSNPAAAVITAVYT